jgi:hypothetical protein
MKLQRNYELLIQNPELEVIRITPPFTLNINIKRDTLASANKGQFSIINLGPSTRARIFKDRYDFAAYWQIQLNAGYGDRLETVFQGNIYEASSVKNGTEWTTSIDAFDGIHAIQNGFTAQTIQAGTSRQNILERVFNDFPNLVRGAIGQEVLQSDPEPRGKVLFGPTAEVLTQETDNRFFIDNEQINVLGDDEILPGEAVVLAEDQLLSTPKRRETFLDVETLFFPKAQIATACALNSLESFYNGIYKIAGLSHQGVISEGVNGRMTTKLSLYVGAAGLREV